MGAVVLDKVCKVYPDGTIAVRDVSLHVADGEFLVLVGPSGCGKSTLLRLVAGLETLSSGSVRIGERLVNEVPPKDRDVAMVFQNYALYPHMTVYQNLAFGLKLRGIARAEIERRVHESAVLLGISELLTRRPKALSGGQRQRVAVGRAMVREPQAFLLDEPLSNLDAAMRTQMRIELRRLHRRLGTTMIYVTHDQVEAMTLGDRIAVMRDGALEQLAEPLSLYDLPATRFVAGFIGTPPMNFFEGTLALAHGVPVFGEGTFALPLAASWRTALPPGAGDRRAVTLGIRPEHILAAAAGSSSIRATVDVVEPLGAETHLHLDTGRHRFIQRLATARTPLAGEVMALTFAADKIHLFDAESGRRLAPEG